MERELTVHHVFVGFVEGRNLESGIRNAEFAGNAESSFIVAMKTYRFYNAPSFCKVEKEE